MEIWKDIKGYEGYYQVSDQGNVKSLKRYVNGKYNGKKLMKGRILKPRNLKGYYSVQLSKEKILKQCLIHRLVGQAFIPNPLNKPQINHKDFNCQNNNVENLEWVTGKENTIHYLEFGDGGHHIKQKDIPDLMEEYSNGKSTPILSKKYNVAKNTIIDTVKRNGGKTRTRSESKIIDWQERKRKRYNDRYKRVH